jgi:hypothetical protein
VRSWKASAAYRDSGSGGGHTEASPVLSKYWACSRTWHHANEEDISEFCPSEGNEVIITSILEIAAWCETWSVHRTHERCRGNSDVAATIGAVRETMSRRASHTKVAILSRQDRVGQRCTLEPEVSMQGGACWSCKPLSTRRVVRMPPRVCTLFLQRTILQVCGYGGPRGCACWSCRGPFTRCVAMGPPMGRARWSCKGPFTRCGVNGDP